MDCDPVDDRDEVDGLKAGSCFGFDERVDVEAVVAVIVGDSGCCSFVCGDYLQSLYSFYIHSLFICCSLSSQNQCTTVATNAAIVMRINQKSH